MMQTTDRRAVRDIQSAETQVSADTSERDGASFALLLLAPVSFTLTLLLIIFLQS